MKVKAEKTSKREMKLKKTIKMMGNKKRIKKK